MLEDTADNGLGFSVQGLYSVLRAPWCMHEFKKGGRPMKHHKHQSPGNVFPLPPLSRRSQLLSWSDARENVDEECLFLWG